MLPAGDQSDDLVAASAPAIGAIPRRGFGPRARHDVSRNTTPAHVDQVVLTSTIVVEHPARRVEGEPVELEGDLRTGHTKSRQRRRPPTSRPKLHTGSGEPHVAEHTEHTCFPDAPRLPVLRISLLQPGEHDSAPAATRGTQVDGTRRKLIGSYEAVSERGVEDVLEPPTRQRRAQVEQRPDRRGAHDAIDDGDVRSRERVGRVRHESGCTSRRAHHRHLRANLPGELPTAHLRPRTTRPARRQGPGEQRRSPLQPCAGKGAEHTVAPLPPTHRARLVVAPPCASSRRAAPVQG